jgi:hypothetical protein
MRAAVRDTAASGGPRSSASGRGATRRWSAPRQGGLARREEVEDLALRVAQVEHRLRLLERNHGS